MQKNKFILLIVTILFCNAKVFTQNNFITKGVITYEVKVNNHKAAFDGEDDEDSEWKKSFIENNPQFSVYNYELSFNETKSLYKFKSKDENAKKIWGDDFLDENIWFHDYASQKFHYQKYFAGSSLRVEDTLKQIEWKIVADDNRVFAGYNCKKAIGKLFDSVYVFAYYTDEIIPTVGPMGLHGLPGAIMAVTIPRMYISILAKSYTPLVNEALLVPPKKGKLNSKMAIIKNITDKKEDYGDWIDRALWALLL